MVGLRILTASLRRRAPVQLVSFGAVSIGAGVGALALGVVLAYRIDSTIVILQVRARGG